MLQPSTLYIHVLYPAISYRQCLLANTQLLIVRSSVYTLNMLYVGSWHHTVEREFAGWESLHDLRRCDIDFRHTKIEMTSQCIVDSAGKVKEHF